MPNSKFENFFLNQPTMQLSLEFKHKAERWFSPCKINYLYRAMPNHFRTHIVLYAKALRVTHRHFNKFHAHLSVKHRKIRMPDQIQVACKDGVSQEQSLELTEINRSPTISPLSLAEMEPGSIRLTNTPDSTVTPWSLLVRKRVTGQNLAPEARRLLTTCWKQLTKRVHFKMLCLRRWKEKQF